MLAQSPFKTPNLPRLFVRMYAVESSLPRSRGDGKEWHEQDKEPSSPWFDLPVGLPVLESNAWVRIELSRNFSSISNASAEDPSSVELEGEEMSSS